MAKKKTAAKKAAGASTPAIQRLTQAGISFAQHSYAHDPRASSYGLEAAELLGLEPGRVFKTLVADLDGDLCVAVVPVDHQLDLKALARTLGGSKAVLAPVPAVERSTGYVTGGVSPIGQKKPLPTVIDDSVLGYETIFVSGGRRGLDIELAPQALIELVGAQVTTLRRR